MWAQIGVAGRGTFAQHNGLTRGAYATSTLKGTTVLRAPAMQTALNRELGVGVSSATALMAGISRGAVVVTNVPRGCPSHPPICLVFPACDSVIAFTRPVNEGGLGLTSAYVLSHNIPHTYYLYNIPHTYFWALAATHHDATAEQHMLQEIHTRDGVYCFAGGFYLCLVHRLQAAIGAEDVGRGSANYRRFLPRWC